MCSLSGFYLVDFFSSSMWSDLRAAVPVLYNPLRVLFRMLRWLVEHPVSPPSIFLPTADGGTRTWLDSFPRVSVSLRYLSTSFND